MAATIAWQERFSVGVKGIDRQHREMLARVNALFEGIGSRESTEQVEALVSFLKRYVHTHFACEEKLMRRHDYPGYARHLLEHQRFVDEIAVIDALYERTDLPEAIVQRVATFVSTWLLDHFQTEDRVLADFLRPCGRRLHPD